MNSEGGSQAGVTAVLEKTAPKKNSESQSSQGGKNEQSVIARAKEKARNLGASLKARFSQNKEVGLRELASGKALKAIDSDPGRVELPNIREEPPKSSVSPENQAAAEAFRKRLEKLYADQQTQGEGLSSKDPIKREGTGDRVLELARKLEDDFDGNGKISDSELREFINYVEERVKDRREQRDEQNRDAVGKPDPDLDVLEAIWYRTYGDPSVLPPDIVQEIIARRNSRKAEQVHGKQVVIAEQENIGLVGERLQEQQDENMRVLIKNLRLNGLTLADIQQHTELFRITPRDAALLASQNQKNIDDILRYEDDPVLKGIRERLLSDDPQNPDHRYATAKSGIRLAVESTATGLRAKSYLEHLSQTTRGGLGEALRLDREKLHAMGGVEGDIVELRQKKVTIGGMEMDVFEADNVLNMLGKLL